MRSYEEEEESSAPLPWIEEEGAVDEALRDVIVPHEGARDPDDGDSNGGGDGDGSRREGRAA